MAPARNLLNVALLHIAPKAGDLAFNQLLIEYAIMKAAAGGADWVITPELAVCGHTFASRTSPDKLETNRGVYARRERSSNWFRS